MVYFCCMYLILRGRTSYDVVGIEPCKKNKMNTFLALSYLRSMHIYQLTPCKILKGMGLQRGLVRYKKRG